MKEPLPLPDYISSEFSDPQLLSVGGQKTVYRANSTAYGAIVLKYGKHNGSASLERPKREYAILSHSASAHFPKQFEFRELPDNTYLIVEEYIEGAPLSRCLADFSEPTGALQLIRHLVVALQVLWKQDIIHRDLKPDNIVIQGDYTPRIIDLGIARMLGQESLTATYAAHGPATPDYSAPEQLWNRKQAINHRTDQFNLGIILLQLVSGGEHPFSPKLVGGISIPENIIAGKWNTSALDRPKLQSLGPLVRKMLAREPSGRYLRPNLLLQGIEQCILELKRR